jgi:multidrug efflux pump subunit AcrA (membrane-fusion protein)
MGENAVAARTVLASKDRLIGFAVSAPTMRVAALIASIAVLWTADGGQASAQGGAKPAQPPFIARGLTGAPEGAVVVSGEPTGGYLLVELRIKERQKVGKGEIIAVLSHYRRFDSALRMAEADLTKLKMTYEAVLKGIRVDEIALQEAALESAIKTNKLQDLQRVRSKKPADQKEIEAALADQALERQKATLELMKTNLAIDLEQYQIDLSNAVARVDNARRTRENTLVRSPIDGIVLQIFTRPGERISPAGIATIVDMRQLRVLADVDEMSVGRVKLGGKVDIKFEGDNTVYKGTVERIAPTVKSMQRPDSGGGTSPGGTSADARFVQVNIMFEDPASVPQVLGREARVAFLE